MDPASIIGLTASIAQLIQTTVKIIGYANAVKNAPTERAQFARHASSLLALLTDLRYRVEEAKSSSDPWFKALLGLGGKGGPLDQLHDQMERLAMKLTPPAGSLKKVGRALTWVIDKKEIEDALTQIERVESLVSLAFQNDQFKLTLAVKRDLQELQGFVSDEVVKRKDDGFRAATDWLSSIDFSAKQADFLHRRQAGTGEWLLSDPTFQHWLFGENRLLWCSGLPGAGKTTLCAMVIDWLSSQYSDQQVATVCFYCSYKEDELHSPQNVIGSLLKQIFQHMPSASEGLSKLYDKHRHNRTRPDLNELTRLITEEAQNFSDIFVVIDALDEYSDRDSRRTTLLDEIEKLPENVRILITSRHSQRIDERFKGVPFIEIRATDEDVKQYVVARCNKETFLAGRITSNQALKEEIINIVVARSQGMFLLAQLHMNSLSKKLTVRQVRSALASLPRELDDTYNQAMERIQAQDEARTALAHRTLYWIVCSLRPMKTEELRHALAIEPGDEDLDEDGLLDAEQLVVVCAGLVTVDEESDEIRLVHYTTQSYFEHDGKKQLRVPPLIIPQTCFTCLLFRPFAEAPCANKLELGIRISRYPFLMYAAGYWGDHLRDGMSSSLKELVFEFLDNSISMLSAQQVFSYARPLLAAFNDIWTAVPNFTRLHVAATFGLDSIAQDLMVDQADVHARAMEGLMPLHMAAQGGHTQMVRVILQMGADIEATSDNGQTALHIAVVHEHQSVLRLLIDAGADCNVRTRTINNYALQFAAFIGNFNIAQLLVGAGAKIDQRTEALDYTPLHQAVIRGHKDLALFLLDNGADIHAVDRHDRATVLHHAVENHRSHIVEALITRGVSINAKDMDGQTALHYASGAGNTEVVQKLLENKADALATDLGGRTALQFATRTGNEEIIQTLLVHIGKQEEADRWLATGSLITAVKGGEEKEVANSLKRGADPNIELRYFFRLRPLLHVAALCGNDTVLRLLLDYGASVHLRGDYNTTALHCAASAGHDGCVRLLLERGADIQAVDNLGATPLHNAASFARLSVLKRLLENGANYVATDRKGKTPMAWMFSPGIMMLLSDNYEHEKFQFADSIAVFDLLVEKVTDPGTAQRYWETCLTATGFWEYHEITEFKLAVMVRLLEKGADMSAPINGGQTALYIAAHSRWIEVVLFLLNNGANVNQVNRVKDCGPPGLTSHLGGATAIHAAARAGSEVITRLLIEAGADVNAVDWYGSTPMREALQEGSIPVIDLLLEHGVDINIRHSDRGRTVLHYAVLEGRVAIARHLLINGADINIRDSDGQTALDIAESTSQEAMIFLLRRHGGV